MQPQFEIQLIAIVVSMACALPGAFLVLRRMSMISDAITHTILLGIVIGFFLTGSLTSPILIVGAGLMGVLTVFLIESLHKTNLLSEDSSIGLVFPFLFSVAIILISLFAGSIHLDVDSVLLGEIAFAPFDRMVVNGVDVGAKTIYTMGFILVLNIALIVIFFKELKIVSFDPMLATVLGFAPHLIHYGLMSMVSITAVGAFGSVGSVLVVAFMIGPPSTAYLLTCDLKIMLILSCFIGGVNAIIGYQVAAYYDVSISGTMAVITGISFFVVFIFAPKRGFVSMFRRSKFLQKKLGNR